MHQEQVAYCQKIKCSEVLSYALTTLSTITAKRRTCRYLHQQCVRTRKIGLGRKLPPALALEQILIFAPLFANSRRWQLLKQELVHNMCLE